MKMPSPEKIREYNRTWKEKNPVAARESHRRAQLKWRTKNRGHVAAVKKLWDNANRDKVNGYRRKQYFKTKYGLTLEERDAMIAAQNGKCAVCPNTSPGNKLGWVVDHCHATGKLRGVLCHRCNLTLGFVNDSVDALRSLIEYVERHK